jgi:c-di-GMP-binding flagellar brake protein YcgR
VRLGSTEQNDNRSRCTGIALDLSLNGICIDLGTEPQAPFNSNLKGRFVQLRLDLMNEVALLDISGKIVWHQRQNPAKGSAALIGIRFDTMDKSDRELLIEYCAGSDAEQNLLWSLWHTMVRNDNPHE